MSHDPQLADLAPSARAWAEAVLAAHDVTATGRQLVVEGARALDLIETARQERAELVKEGRYKGTERQHPTIAIERAARADYLRVVGLLKLDQEVA